jgi:pyruvate ferredoxin oxidoreductase beta subunit
MHGARYIQVFVPCPLGWGSQPAKTVNLARLAIESGIYPLFEAEHGEITSVTKIRNLVQVDEYLKHQRRFAHVMKNPEQLSAIQATADRNIQKYGLLGGQE